jgi:asparagine synthase (glutamine-hydrolysing)
MANENDTVWTVFNGEIYNHRDLRLDLERRGHVFRGSSDTEVIPHLYEEHGPSFVSKLRGMFALAIFDVRTQRVLLTRDRFGIKPLFYAARPERLAFASELNALRLLPDIDERPDRQAIHDFAALFYIPAPETFYAGIKALAPGETLVAQLGTEGVSFETRAYHQWSISPDPSMRLAEATERAEDLMTTAVRRQMESDVPLGALLSGGIDSSLVSVAAQNALNGRLRTFNVRFWEKEFDETWAAVAVAQQIGSDHKTLEMEDVRGTWRHFTALLEHVGQPFADASLFAVNAVCRLMRQHVTVALSGDGGDEGFGGYSFYWQLGKIARWQELPRTLSRAAAIAAKPMTHLDSKVGRLSQRLREMTGADDTSIIQGLFCWLREQEHQTLSRQNGVLPVRRLFEQRWEHHGEAKFSRVERLSMLATEANIRLMLPNDFLFKVDMASMKESLEVRVPMLDEDLFDFALSLPHHLKVNGRTGKRVLRRIAERRLPPEVANKAKKGFDIPVDKWVDEDFKMQLRETLLGPGSKLPEYFQPEVYQPMVKAFCEGHTCPGVSRQGLYQRVMMLLSVELALAQPSLRSSK